MDNSCYSGFIINLSEEGIFYMTTPVKNQIEFMPGTALNIKFQLPSGDNLHLPCIIKWSLRTHPQGLASSMGMAITDPPPEYKKYLETI